MEMFSTPLEAALWLRRRGVRRLHTDSRKVSAGDAFLAWPGARQDGRQHLEDALQRGAAACLIEANGFQQGLTTVTPACALYAGLKADCGPIAAAYYDHPSKHIEVMAATGTNGKTSCVWWLAQALVHLDQRCAMVGTLGLGELVLTQGGAVHLNGMSTGLTTPEAVLLQGALRDLFQAGVRSCAIEASSIGLVEGRLDGTRIRIALFTNFTQDHLDYHGDMDAYWQAKQRLFDWPDLEVAVIGVDDPQGQKLVRHLSQHRPTVRVITYGLDPQADVRAEHVRWQSSTQVSGDWYQSLDIVAWGERLEMTIPWVGEHNVRNLLAVIAMLRALGHGLEPAGAACQSLQPVPGRMQSISQAGEPLAVIDYAHTPDALMQALKALRPLAERRGGRLWCVFGCGGDRDRSKRPEMGRVAQAWADRVVLTSDNPRQEEPMAILRDIRAGLLQPQGQVSVQIDRALAIAETIRQADPADVVLVAGKGHETYQEVGGERLPFSDVQQVRMAMRKEVA